MLVLLPIHGLRSSAIQPRGARIPVKINMHLSRLLLAMILLALCGPASYVGLARFCSRATAASIRTFAQSIHG